MKTSPAPTSERGGGRPTGAFTFLEILVALGIISVVVIALLAGQAASLRAEQKARAADALALSVDQAFATARLGDWDPETMTQYNGCTVEAAVVAVATGGYARVWRRVEFSRPDRLGTRAVFFRSYELGLSSSPAAPARISP